MELSQVPLPKPLMRGWLHLVMTPLALIDKRPGGNLNGVLRNWGLVFTGNFAGAFTVAVNKKRRVASTIAVFFISFALNWLINPFVLLRLNIMPEFTF